MSLSKNQLLSRRKIAVDMDHVMADTGAYLCDWLNDRYGSTHHNESFVTLLDKLPEDQKAAMIDHVSQGSLMRDLPVMQDCQRVLRVLSERFAIVICTAAMEFPATIQPKIEWLDKHFPFLDRQLFVFCGYKQVMGTEYLIDDSAKHFKGFSGNALLYEAPHNKDEVAYDRVADWLDVENTFQTL